MLGPRSLRGSLIRLPLRSLPAVVAVLACSVASPATEVREALERAAPLEMEAGPGRVAIARAAFRDVAVSMDGSRALVVAAVDADGHVRAGGREVPFGYVGREAFAMERCPGRRWCAAGGPLPALAAVIEALLEAPRPDGRKPVGWQIRVERDRAAVGEDAELPGGARAPRGILELVHERGGWRIAGGR